METLLAYFKIVQEGHQPGSVGDCIEYPIHLGNKYVELGILSICNELGEDILPDHQLDHTIMGQWPSDKPSPTREDFIPVALVDEIVSELKDKGLV